MATLPDTQLFEVNGTAVEFPVFRKRKYEHWGDEFLMMIEPGKSFTIVLYRNGDQSHEIDSLADFDQCMRIYSVPSTSSEFTAALEEVQKKIKEAVKIEQQ